MFHNASVSKIKAFTIIIGNYFEWFVYICLLLSTNPSPSTRASGRDKLFKVRKPPAPTLQGTCCKRCEVAVCHERLQRPRASTA